MDKLGVQILSELGLVTQVGTDGDEWFDGILNYFFFGQF